MNSIDETKKKRFQFLDRVFELSKGNQYEQMSMWDVGKELGFNDELTEIMVQYLVEERLIEHKAIGGFIGITHWGIRKIEEALSNPDEPTQYFPPVNIISIGQMVNSQIQQASPGAQQSITINDQQKEDIEKFLKELKESIDKIELNAEQESDVKADIGTIEAQMKSTKPKTTVVRESLKSIKNILEGAAGGVIAGTLIQHITPLIAALL